MTKQKYIFFVFRVRRRIKGVWGRHCLVGIIPPKKRKLKWLEQDVKPRYTACMEQVTLFSSVAAATAETVSVRGTLERVVFHNAENGYTVFRLRPEGKNENDIVTVVGHMVSPQSGAFVMVYGMFVNNPKFGRQFKMERCETVLPSSVDGIRMYLSSGLIKGIGKGLATRIVDKFGEQTLNILDTDPQQLLKVSGISLAKLETIQTCWEEHQGIRELMLFLQPHDIGVAYAVRMYRHYGAQALSIVRDNPYRLAMDIRGIGFLTADALASKLGFEKDNALRAQAGTLYTLLRLVDDGHVYYPREGLILKTTEQLDIRADLVEEAITQLEHEERIVLEDLNGETGVYISRFHHCEAKLAHYLKRILHSPKSVRFSDNDDDILPQVVKEVVEKMPMALAPEQLEAVKTAAKAKMMILTGGPGTGKTTILKAIIDVFAARKAKILLAAPTGRAAKRMSETCRREARTIHRLLEYSPKEDGFARNEDNPLTCGLLVVDEASMMDVLLAYHLLKATPLGATVLFVGDVHQLPSVGPGNVLRDFITSGAMPVVELVDVFRQAASSAIVCNAHMINKGEMPTLESSKERLSDFYFMRQNDPERVLETIVELVRHHIPRRFGLDPVEDIQVLAPMHKGTVGSANLNQRLQEALNPNAEGVQRGERVFRCGDKVMQIRNNYDKDVYNGDIGRISFVDAKERLVGVCYDERLVSYEFEELDEIVTAYAISIHKSQGSEYPAVVIPLLTQHYMLLQRNLVYTGVTRGKQLVVLIGESKALHMAIKNNRMLKRFTWLAKRLQHVDGL